MISNEIDPLVQLSTGTCNNARRSLTVSA